jgi:antitoxin (DNA-binding transcriptional repressor) of toxin-antitoxin stability system
MKVITVAKFRRNLSACLNAVADGDSLMIKRRNQVVAKLSPPDSDPDIELTRLVETGRVKLGEMSEGTPARFYRLPKTRAVRYDLGALIREERDAR